MLSLLDGALVPPDFASDFAFSFPLPKKSFAAVLCCLGSCFPLGSGFAAGAGEGLDASCLTGAGLEVVVGAGAGGGLRAGRRFTRGLVIAPYLG